MIPRGTLLKRSTSQFFEYELRSEEFPSGLNSIALPRFMNKELNFSTRGYDHRYAEVWKAAKKNKKSEECEISEKKKMPFPVGKKNSGYFRGCV